MNHGHRPRTHDETSVGHHQRETILLRTSPRSAVRLLPLRERRLWKGLLVVQGKRGPAGVPDQPAGIGGPESETEAASRLARCDVRATQRLLRAGSIALADHGGRET